jgi:hypothetical protein
MKKWLIVLFTTFTFALEISLNSGWNLVGLDGNITLSKFKQMVGEENLLVIQSQDKVYKKSYIDSNKSFLNDFTSFKDGKGAWVKLKNGVTINYEQKDIFDNKEIELKEGWNLISPLSQMSLSDIVASIGPDNILIIQGQDGTYKKSFSDNNLTFLNDFEKFNSGKGYLVKVKQKTKLKFVIKPKIKAIDYLGNKIEFEIDGYKFEVLTNSKPNSEISKDFVAIYGIFNGIKINNQIKINATYPKDTQFMIVVKKDNQTVYESEYLNNDKEAISFEEITLNSGGSENNSTIDETQQFRGVYIFAKNMPFSKYKLTPLSDSEFNQLSFENRLKVANKLLSTLYYGMPYDSLKELINSGKFISTMQKRVYQKSDNLKEVEKLIANKDIYKDACLCNMLSLARLYHLHFGKEFIDRWSAYVLNQTILFSPAFELGTISSENICNVNAELINGFNDNYTIRFLTFLHTISENNWRRFRSPEDNGREMLEIYLMDFNDSHVPLAAKALQNWRLEGTKNTLVIDSNRNFDPINLFDTTIYDGIDFYIELVKYKDFMPTIVKRIVDIYFINFTDSQRDEIVKKIVQSNVKTFEDILLQIVFSKEYLLNAKKYLTLEERFLSLAKKMDINGKGYYYFVSVKKALERMGQASMTYKLGRVNKIPTDTFSVANYKNFIQSELLDPRRGDSETGWNRAVVVDSFGKDIKSNLDEYINYLFLNFVNRSAKDEEKNLLKEIIANRSNQLYITNIILAYISKLSEFYRVDPIKE